MNEQSESTSQLMTLENVLRSCGSFGRFHWIHYFFLNCIAIGSGLNAFYYVFGVAEPRFRCRLHQDIWNDEDFFHPINSTHELLINGWISSVSSCITNNTSKCSDFVFDRSVFGKTFIEESKFVCDAAVKATWLSTLAHIGT